MSAVEDVRKVIQDLVAPDLKAIVAKLETFDTTSKLRDDALSAKIDHSTSELKLRDDALSAKIDYIASESKLRDDALASRFDAKFELILARMDAQHATVMNALGIDKRLEVLEREREVQPHAS